jgi:hypothetical protein
MTAQSPDSAYEQGLAYLKRAEYEAAVSAFTEVIRAIPKAANAYAGRALASRSLGDESGAIRDEQITRELGGVKPPREESWTFLTPPRPQGR